MVMPDLKLPSKSKECDRALIVASSLALMLVISMLLFLPVLAGTETGEFCPTCPDWTDLDGWLAKKEAYEQEQQKALHDEKGAKLKTQNATSDQSTPEGTHAPSNLSRMRIGSFAQALVSPIALSSDDVVLDISPNMTKYAEGAVNINYEQFMGQGGSLMPVLDIAELLGNAGISRNDSVVIAGECLPCGGGPSPAIFTYWLLRYLGHEKVRVLDGSIGDWTAAGLNTSNMSATRLKTNYIPTIKPELLATYDFVLNGGAQIVDARPSRDYGIGSIPGSLNIPYEGVVENESIKPQEDLQGIFAVLDRERPVVVYTNVGVEASLVWFALNLSGYDARLYSWRDWLENQPEFGYELAQIEANPNPVRSGQATSITALFRERQAVAFNPSSNLSPNEEVKLTVKGCVTVDLDLPKASPT
jgi:thiosulfate/3-mercaptopyruvate sulfurtransferase